MQINILTLFPEMIEQALGHSILKRAQDRGLLVIRTVNPRDFATDAHRTVDDSPYGGGPGMVMKPEPIHAALLSLDLAQPSTILMPDPTGPVFDQSWATLLAVEPCLTLVCGHYEGIDDRIRQRWNTQPVSVGDFVLTGGELAALIVIDAVGRLIPGVLGNQESLGIDSHSDGLLSAPQFTRPEVWDGLAVPEVLTTGDHSKIAKWRRAQALRLTRDHRPDLFARARLEKGDLDLLQ
ncbi:MAG: tRNA (guanosine(37)-N1)-methyltransferase TrmD [Methanoregulaceae archaeon]|nr:tRNA (guanosine(37)-N1)-methyltransferase TrmD [Methanoregulaceae archaeon]